MVENASTNMLGICRGFSPLARVGPGVGALDLLADLGALRDANHGRQAAGVGQGEYLAEGFGAGARGIDKADGEWGEPRGVWGLKKSEREPIAKASLVKP